MIKKIDILRMQIHHLERLYDMSIQTEERGLQSAIHPELLALYKEAIELDLTTELKTRYEQLLQVKIDQK